MKMNILIITGITAITAFTLWQAWLVMSSARTEQRPYSIQWTHDRSELRDYPASTIAYVRGSSSSYAGMAYPGFRKLAGYIFGGNNAGQQIAMTAPVVVRLRPDSSEMAFVMPAHDPAEALPMPLDSTVQLRSEPGAKVLVIRFGGWIRDTRMPSLEAELLEVADARGLRPLSTPFYMAYNPPFQLFARRNEVAIEVE
jgi:hypothetical protein